MSPDIIQMIEDISAVEPLPRHRALDEWGAIVADMVRELHMEVERRVQEYENAVTLLCELAIRSDPTIFPVVEGG